MKNIKTIGLIVVIAVIVFAFTACSLENEIKEKTVPGESLAAKLQWVRDHKQEYGCYLIELTSSWESIGPQVLPRYCSIRLKGIGSSPTVIQLSGEGSLFTVREDGTLVLDENISLVGKKGNNAALITVAEHDSRLIMKQGSKISGNTAIFPHSNYNNSAYGGGVAVARGTFIMNGGEISGNAAFDYDDYYYRSPSRGGGVYVSSGGTFRIANGTVYGSDAEEGLKNYGAGAALYNDGTAQCGTFEGTKNKKKWYSRDSLTTTSHTIRVINGGLVEFGNITAPVWRDGNTVSLTAPEFTLPAGQTITAQGWQISDTGDSDWTDFTSSTVDMSYNGKYLRYYATSSGDSNLYSNVVQIKVISATAREVTIAMYDSAGDGWDSGGALRINVNETDIDTNVRVSSGSTNTYTFSVTTGDVVELYWVAGSSQSENSFIVYYTNTPPSPEFSASNNSSWDGTNALVYRLRYTMGSISDGTLLGSFTVP